MAEEIRVNKVPGMQPRMMNNDDMGGTPPKQGGSKMPWIVLVIVIALIGIGLFVFRGMIFPGAKPSVQGAVTGKASGYQAVFLTNGQVYFGKVQDRTAAYVKMTDIYYLQVTQPPLQGSQSQQQQQQQSQQQPQISLVKLGKELHGPDDKMDINKDQILFIEDMLDDAKVVQAIREYKANPNGTNTTAPTSQGSQNLGGQQTQVQGATTNTPASSTQAPAMNKQNQSSQSNQ